MKSKQLMKNKSASQSILICLFAVLTFAVCGSPAWADSTAWNNPGTGDWFTPANWSNGVPTFLLDAFISNGGQAEISDPSTQAQAHSLTLGQNAGESGTLLVDIAPNTQFTNLLMYGTSVGSGGTGTLLITSGGFVGTIGPASIASTPGSNGTVSVKGQVGAHASTWTIVAPDNNPAQLSIGGTQGGTAVLDVHDHGAIEVSDSSTQTGPSVVVGPSGTLTGNGLIVVVGAGSTSRQVQVNGTLAPSGASGSLRFSFAQNSNSSLTLTHSATTECNVTPQDNPTSPQISVSPGAASLDGRLSVTMTGDFSSAPTRYTLLYAAGGRDPSHLFFSSVSFKYPTGLGWAPQITYDGDYVYLDRVYYLTP